MDAEEVVTSQNQAQTIDDSTKNLTDYKAGDTFRGQKIFQIYFAQPEFLICRTDAGFAYKIVLESPKVPQILAELSKCDSVQRPQLRGAYKKDYFNLLATALNSALLSMDDDPRSQFEPVRSFIDERGPVEYVYGYSPNFIVYLNNRKVVAYDYDDLPSRLIPAVTQFHRLQHVANCSLLDADKNEVGSILGMDLVSALRSSEGADLSALFLSSREFITNRSEAVLRSHYVRSSVLSSLIVLIVLAVITYYFKKNSIGAWTILLGSAAGVIGAMISIIQRGVSLTVNPFVPLAHVVFQGTVRVGLGAVFGALLVVASKAGIALGILEGNIWSLFIFSVVAGFSERFVPDILDRIAVEKHGALKIQKRKEAG
ncbi:MAG TPA: hypothetical protein VF397_12195 [Pyrinomonadaceae bacterium]